MDSALHSLNQKIAALYNKTTSDANSTENVINLERFQLRETCLCELNILLRQCQETIANITEKIDAVSVEHNAELKKMNNLLNGTRVIQKIPMDSPKRVPKVEKPASQPAEPLTASWSLVAAGGRRKKESPARTIPPTITEIPIAGNYTLTATKVPDWQSLEHMSEGTLYYVDISDNFAISIAGQFLYGNIGRVYTDEKEPIKIKSCKYSDKCFKDDCGYYHDPMIAVGSRDRRNFIASSWLYAANDFIGNNGRRARRFGDIANVEKDLPYMTEEENERFIGQTMHDLLCSLLLRRYGHVENPRPKKTSV